MANEVKNSRKKTTKKKAAVRKAGVSKNAGAARTNAEQKVDYETRLARHRRAAMRRALLALTAALAVAALVFIYIEKRTYHNYKVLETSEQEDIISTKYVEMDGKILRYSPDGVSLVNKKMETLWSETHSMQNPVADVKGDHAVVADQDGTAIEIYDTHGLTGSISTSYTIVKARVSQSGLVAAILGNGEDTWINFYSYDGSLIAENQTKIDDPGYPLDVSISNDGLVMMVTYQFVDGSDTTSYVAFYNFGDVGQNEDDRIVSGYTYDGVVIPQVVYLGGTTSAAIREDGFTLYKGKQIPKESKTVKVEQEIVSTFYDKDTIGLIFRSEDKEKPYKMEVYSTDGSLKFTKNFAIPYTTVKMSEGMILLYNDSQICVMNSRGSEKFTGTIDGVINNFFKIGWNKYLLVLDSGIRVIKFA